MTQTNPDTFNERLDEWFTRALNAKQTAVNVARQENEFASNADLVAPANELLEKLRAEFRSAIKQLLSEEKEAWLKQIMEEKPLTTANSAVNLWAERIKFIMTHEAIGITGEESKT